MTAALLAFHAQLSSVCNTCILIYSRKTRWCSRRYASCTVCIASSHNFVEQYRVKIHQLLWLVDDGDSVSSSGSHAIDKVGCLACRFILLFSKFLPVGLNGPAKHFRPVCRQLVWFGSPSCTGIASTCGSWGARHPAPRFRRVTRMLTCHYEKPWVGLYVATGGLSLSLYPT